MTRRKHDWIYNLAIALTIIGFLGTVISGFWNSMIGSIVMLVLFFSTWQIWLTKKILNLEQIESSLLSKKIAQEPDRKYLKEPTKITASKKNLIRIPSDFIFWEQCSIMFWVRVPPYDEGLRNSPSHRYLFAHSTGRIDYEESENYSYCNQFSLRHTKKKNSWNFNYTEQEGKYGPGVEVKDGLNPGWHHFLLSWDCEEASIELAIDGGKSGNNRIKADFSFWPQRLASSVTIGSWVSHWDGHYCETEIAKFYIYKKKLSIDSEEVIIHSKKTGFLTS